MRRNAPQTPAPFLERTPILEWMMAALGLALALGAIGFLTWQGLHTDDRSPVLSARALATSSTPHGYVVDVEIRNESRATASEVEVEGVLTTEGRADEQVTLTFDYVPGLGRRQGSMSFQQDPRGHPVELQVKGQIDP